MIKKTSIILLLLTSIGCSAPFNSYRSEIDGVQKNPADSLEFEYIMSFKNQDQPSLLHLQTNSITDSLWIFEDQFGWKKIKNETAEKLKHPEYKIDSILNIIYNE